MIDEAKPARSASSSWKGTLDIAAMGNLMATAALERGMAGVVLDGAIRDMWDIRRMGQTVYARSKSPRTAVGHYATVDSNVPVVCAGITVRPGDIIVADEDGVVVVPQEQAAAVLKRLRKSTTANAACTRSFDIQVLQQAIAQCTAVAPEAIGPYRCGLLE